MTVTVEQALAWASERNVGALVTLRKDGRAQTSDIVYALIDGDLCISLTATRAKTANMRRDPRIVLHISDPDAWSYVSLDGVADLGLVTTDPADDASDDLVTVYRAIAGEEHGDWPEFRAAMIAEQRQVLRIRPTSVTGQINQ